jgi:hypothetical protein
MKRSRRFPETTASVSPAPQFVAESPSAVEPEVAELAALLVSELATNAVVRVRVEVMDGVPGKPMPLRPPPTLPAVDAPAADVRRPLARLFRRRRRGLSFFALCRRPTIGTFA